jgi:dynein heavy chain
VNELPRYLKKSQSLDHKLRVAANKIRSFNQEETAFGWDNTQYPLREQVNTVYKCQQCNIYLPSPT